MFSEQFKPDGDAYVYRRNHKGAAYRISAREYEDFIASFKKQCRLLVWGGGLVMGAIVLLAGFVLSNLWS